MSSYLTTAQVEQILRPINPSRVYTRDGMAYVEAYEVRAHMARIYGVARWSSEVIEQHLLFEEAVQTKAGKPAWYVGYRSIVRVTVCAPDGTQLAVYTEGHAGDSTHPSKGEAHGNAIANSESYAFKRGAVMALLDQGGLSLYGKGSKAALVKRSLVMPETGNNGHVSAGTVDHDVEPVTPEVPVEEPAEPPAEYTQAVAERAEQIADLNLTALALRERILAEVPAGENANMWFARLSAEAAKSKVLSTPVTDGDGNALTVKALIDLRLKQSKQAAA